MRDNGREEEEGEEEEEERRRRREEKKREQGEGREVIKVRQAVSKQICFKI